MELTVVEDSLSECQVSVAGEVRHDPREFTEPLEKLLGGFRARRMLLGFEYVTGIDGSGVSWLLGCRQAVARARGELVLHSLPLSVTTPLGLLNLLGLFVTAESLKAAQSLSIAELRKVVEG